MANQPVLRVGEMRARPGKESDLQAFTYRVIVPALQTAEGCLGVDVWQDTANPLRFLIIEEWESVEAHRASVQQIDPEEIREIMTLLDDSPQGQYFRALD